MTSYEKKLAKFQAFDAEHPDIWEAFEKQAQLALSMGRRRLSAWLIINQIRWDRIVNQGVDDARIGNDFIAFYARKFMQADPANRAHFFTIKRMAGENFTETLKACGMK